MPWPYFCGLKLSGRLFGWTRNGLNVQLMSIGDQKSPLPKDGFRNFLSKAENDAWLASYKWTVADNYPQLKLKLGGPRAENSSRTHKKGTDGSWWALDAEAHEGTQIGVDLELFMTRPILTDPDWITRRLNLSRSLSPQKILEEWSAREASFKALAPNNGKILMSHFKRTSPTALSVFTPQGDRSIQVRTAWAGKWLLSIAWSSH
jgi:hypothetical protein